MDRKRLANDDPADDVVPQKKVRFEESTQEIPITDSPDNDEVVQAKEIRRRKREAQLAYYDDEQQGGEESVDPAKFDKEKWLRFSKSSDTQPMEPFNMHSDLKLGRFDAAGSFIFNRRSRQGSSGDEADDEDDAWTSMIRKEQKGLAKRPNDDDDDDDEMMPTAIDEKRPAARQNELIEELVTLLESDRECPASALRRLKKTADKGRMPPNVQDKFDKITSLCDLLAVECSLYMALTLSRVELMKHINNSAPKNSNTMWQYRVKGSSGSPPSAAEGPVDVDTFDELMKSGKLTCERPMEIREVLFDGVNIIPLTPWQDSKELLPSSVILEDEIIDRSKKSIKEDDIQYDSDNDYDDDYYLG